MKNILNREGISYQEELDQLKNSANAETIETNQRSRIVFPNEITKDMANRFFARFWGRTDVYAKRVENKKTNKDRNTTGSHADNREIFKNRQRLFISDFG